MVKIILFVPPVVEANLDVEARELGWLDNDRSNHLPRRRLYEAGDMHRNGHGLLPRCRGSNYHNWGVDCKVYNRPGLTQVPEAVE